jgi:hypothetical protein
MAARITIERILRDEDDASGQSIRSWIIASEPEHVTVKLKHGDGFLLLRAADVDQFAADLQRAREAALSLAAEEVR